MFLIALLTTMAFLSPLGALLALRRNKPVAVTLIGVTVFTHTLAWVWIITSIRGVVDPSIVPVGAMAEVMIIGAAMAAAEMIDS